MACFKIVNPETIEIVHSYEMPNKINFIGEWAAFPQVQVPQNLDPDCVIAQFNGQEIELVEDATLLAQKAQRVKQAQIAERYNAMNADVYAQMMLVFGTNKSDSATAFFETWKLMSASPAMFVSEGLKADKEVGIFNPGDALDTEQKVQEYAVARINEANAYSVYRMKRIEQFRAERSAIEAG